MGRKTEQSKKVYNNMAAGYDSSEEGNYTRFHRTELIETVRVRENDTILDVACGNGALLSELSKKAAVSAFGIDISDNMIAIAKKRHPNCKFEVYACYPLAFADESVDVITVSCAFHHFENPQEFANECRRVLKKDGMIYIADPNYGLILRWICNTFVFRLMQTGDVKVYSRRELNHFFTKAGFRDVQIYEKGKGRFLHARK